MAGWNPSIGADSRMSSASPCGRPSTMSISTTSSASPFWTIRMAAVAPTNPLPTTVTLMEPPRVDEEAILASAGAGLRADVDAGLLEHQGEVVGLRGGEERVLDGYDVALHQGEEALVERLHPIEAALRDHVQDLRRPLGVDDPIGDPAVVHHDLHRRHAAAALARHEPL